MSDTGESRQSFILAILEAAVHSFILGEWMSVRVWLRETTCTLHLWPDAVLDLYHRNIISHVCKCIHFTAKVRITYAVMNQADHSHERRQHDRR